MNAQELYHQRLDEGNDMSDCMPTLLEYAHRPSVMRVTEFGTRRGNSTAAFLHAAVVRLDCYDLDFGNLDRALYEKIAEEKGITLRFFQEHTERAKIAPCDLLLVDSYHSYGQVSQELLCADRVARYIAFHDTVKFGQRGEQGERGILDAISEFLSKHPEWLPEANIEGRYGMIILRRD